MTPKLAKPRLTKVKSGRLPYVHDYRTFDLSTYLPEENLASVPKEYNWGKKIKRGQWGSLGNLKINDGTA